MIKSAHREQESLGSAFIAAMKFMRYDAVQSEGFFGEWPSMSWSTAEM